jgi:hypothetical protein
MAKSYFSAFILRKWATKSKTPRVRGSGGLLYRLLKAAAKVCFEFSITHFVRENNYLNFE